MSAPAVPRLFVPALAATAGVVMAHSAGYLLAFPGGGARQAHLHATGHGYWPAAVGVAMAAGALAVLIVAASALHRTAGRRGSAAVVPWRLWPLVAVQVLAFVALETAERSAAGLPLPALASSAELWMGLALQFPVAWLARRLLGGVGSTVAALARRRRPVPARRGRALAAVPGPAGVPPDLVLALATPARAPPGR